MNHRIVQKLTGGKKLLLAGVGMLAVAVPVVVGVLNAPAVRAQTQPPAVNRAVPAAPAEPVPDPQIVAQQSVAQPAAVPGVSSPKPFFEVVSIRPGSMIPAQCSDRPLARVIGIACGGPGTSSPERYDGHSVQLKGVIQGAFGLQAFQIIGPDWIATARFDITAVVPSGATREQFNQMMQGMLEDRFHLKVHHEMRKFSGYNLVLAKGGLKLKELSPSGCAVGMRAAGGTCPQGREYVSGIAIAQASPNRFGSMTVPSSGGRIASGSSVTMEYFAQGLQAELKGSVVIDKTGLDGKYDYRFEYSPPDVSTAGEFSAPSLFTAIEKDLGLKLEPIKTQLDCIVIDHIAQPSDN